jgi:hypothetical protein
MKSGDRFLSRLEHGARPRVNVLPLTYLPCAVPSARMALTATVVHFCAKSTYSDNSTSQE